MTAQTTPDTARHGPTRREPTRGQRWIRRGPLLPGLLFVIARDRSDLLHLRLGGLFFAVNLTTIQAVTVLVFFAGFVSSEGLF